MASLQLPQSTSTVRVRAIDCKCSMSLHSHRFFSPNPPGFSTINLTNTCYLIDHPVLHKRILFDCGARKDYENYSPTIKSRLNAIVKGMRIEADVNDVLVDAGIELESLDAIVWSHWHWDHVGKAEAFPQGVELVVGPGFKENFMPGWPVKEEAPTLEADFRGRNVREISFAELSLRIGQFPAYDLWGDGSFYLLDSPGHAIGHVCALARTTESTFILLGGDACHYPGVFRPSDRLPLPDPIPSDQLDDYFPSPCPCSLFTDNHPLVDGKSDVARSSPFFEVSTAKPSSYQDREKAMESLEKLQELDASPDVLVCLAHEPLLLSVLPLLNDDPSRDLNDWKRKGFKEKLQWGWLNELPRDGKPGRPMLVEGVWRNGEVVTDFEQLQRSKE